MNNNELRELVHLLLMCGIMDKTATESGNVTNEEWLRMKNLINKYQTEGGINCEPDKSGDLISREALKEEVKTLFCPDGYKIMMLQRIDNAPTVPLPDFKEGYKQAILDGKTNYSRPQGDIFPMEIVAGKCPIEAGGNCPLKPQGEWIFRKGVTCGGYYKCNKCGEVERAEKNYCPNCGASMKGGAE